MDRGYFSLEYERLTLLAVSAPGMTQKASAPEMAKHWQHPLCMFTVVSGIFRAWEPCHVVFDRHVWRLGKSVHKGTSIDECVWST